MLVENQSKKSHFCIIIVKRVYLKEIEISHKFTLWKSEKYVKKFEKIVTKRHLAILMEFLKWSLVSFKLQNQASELDVLFD